MVIIEHKIIREVPTLHIVKEQKMETQAPLIIFIHGFTSAKEHNLHFAYLLAEEGFRVILPDALYHGERNEGLKSNELNYKFWEIVLNNIKEIENIKEELVALGLADSERIGVVGTSMGGITTFGALTQYNWIKAAVSLMGCPNYEMFSRGIIHELKKNGERVPFTDEEIEQQITFLKRYDLSSQPEKLKHRPMMIWHGRFDEVVPFQYTYDFYQQIRPFYKGSEDLLKFIEDPKAGHKVSREGLIETVNWFKYHLAYD